MSATTTTTADTPLAPSPTPTPESYTLPSAAALSRAAACTIKDEHGAALPFSALYAADGEKRNPGERTLAVFVRHFFCGSCEEYIRSLTPVLPPSVLSALPKPTRLVFIGCGEPSLIPRYRERTMSHLREKGEKEYELYCDPTQEIYKALGMVTTLTNPATAPSYISTGYWSKVAAGISGMFTMLPTTRSLTAGGPPGQNGGEFLFDERGTLVWSHRMQCTQDHCGVDELAEVLGVKG